MFLIALVKNRLIMVLQEVMGLAEPARKVANKIPDVRLYFLSARLLRQLGRSSGVGPFKSFYAKP